MQMRTSGCGRCLVAVLSFACAGWVGQTNAADEEQQSLQEQIARLQQEIKDANDRHTTELKKLQGQVESLPQQATEANEPVAEQEQGQAEPLRQLAQSFNPDVSVIGDLLFHAGKDDEGENKSEFRLRELELAFGAAVDPYGRADFFVFP